MAKQLTESVPDDRHCMRILAEGDLRGLGCLYERHKDRVFALALRIMGQSILAEDICQETFLRVQQAAGTYKPQAEFTTWLYRIVVNLCLDEKRKQTRRSWTPLSPEAYPERTGNRSSNHDSQERSFAVRKALQTLNERQRKAVLLHKIEGLSHAEISAKTGWSQSTVESLLVRAYKNLRKQIEKAILR